MNGYLIDTHVWLWIVGGLEHAFKASDRDALLAWQQEERLLLSPMSAWEVAQKQSSGKLEITVDTEKLVERSLEPGRFRLTDLSIDILIAANRLPGDIQGDPVDRILAATARERDLTLVTHDTGLLRYAKQGHLKVHKI